MQPSSQLAEGGAPIISLELVRQAITFVRDPSVACPDDAVRAILRTGNDPSTSDECRLRLRGRLRGAAPIEDLEMLDHILSGAPYKTVAAATGLSLRHFFRRRDALLARLVTGLSRGTPPAEVKARSDEAQARLSMASRLLAKGFPVRAATHLTGLLESGAGDGLRPLAILARARARFDTGDAAGAAADLRAALRRDGGNSYDVLSEALFTESFLHYREGRYHASLELAERAAELLQREPLLHPGDIRRHVSNLHFLAMQHQEGGSTRRSIEVYLTARQLIFSIEKPPLRELSENLAFCAISRVALPGQLSVAWQESNEARDIAHLHGLDREEVWSNLAVAIVANAAGRYAQSIGAARTGLALARECLGGDELCRILNANSRLETNGDNIQRAMELLPEIRDLRGSVAPFMAGITLLVEARIHEAADDAAGAQDAATRSIETLERLCKSHYIGLAYTTRAATIRSLRAAPDLEAAITYLRNGGSTDDLARALELSASLTGNRRHQREAHELRMAAVL